METDERRAAAETVQLMDTDDVVAAVGGMAGDTAAKTGAGPEYPAWHPHVGECVAHSARLLESLLGNADFAGQVCQISVLQGLCVFAAAVTHVSVSCVSKDY